MLNNYIYFGTELKNNDLVIDDLVFCQDLHSANKQYKSCVEFEFKLLL